MKFADLHRKAVHESKHMSKKEDSHSRALRHVRHFESLDALAAAKKQAADAKAAKYAAIKNKLETKRPSEEAYQEPNLPPIKTSVRPLRNAKVFRSHGDSVRDTLDEILARSRPDYIFQKPSHSFKNSYICLPSI